MHLRPLGHLSRGEIALDFRKKPLTRPKPASGFWSAERVGFEPTVTFATPDFESGTFDHSDTSPRGADNNSKLAAF